MGTRTLTEETDRLSVTRLSEIAATVAQDKDAEVVIVSSGAVAVSGSWSTARPATRLQDRQAAAAVGQGRLMRMWSDVFGTGQTRS